jgi:hypothetical protein
MSNLLTQAELEAFSDQAIALTYCHEFAERRAVLTREEAITIFLRKCLDYMHQETQTQEEDQERPRE